MRQWIKQYLEHLSRTKSEATIKNYRRYLERFADWLSDTFGETSPINQQVVEHYRYWLEQQAFSASTLNYHLIILRGFLKFLKANNLAQLEPSQLQLLTVQKHKELDFLSPKELKNILRVSWKGTGQFQGLRNQLIVGLLYSTGLRLSEAAALNRKNIDTRALAVVGLGRPLFIDKTLLNPLNRYLAERLDSAPALFVRGPKADDDSDLRVSERTIERAVASAGRQAGITRGVSPHTLRHTLGVDLRSAGLSLEKVQKVLGYQSPTASISYPKLSDRPLTELQQRYLGAYQ